MNIVIIAAARAEPKACVRRLTDPASERWENFCFRGGNLGEGDLFGMEASWTGSAYLGTAKGIPFSSFLFGSVYYFKM